MAKKEKSIEKRRKTFKRKGIAYGIICFLLIAATIAININGVQRLVNKAVFPKSETLTIDNEKREVFSELSVVGGVDVSSYYYIDGNGKKVALSPYQKLTKITQVQTSFISEAKMWVILIKGIITALMVIFLIIYAIYFIRLFSYMSNDDEELKQKAGEKFASVLYRIDKIKTGISKLFTKKKA